MTDQENTDQSPEPRYEWRSNGGCERCDAIDGHICQEEPPRPHPNCDCIIIDRSRPSQTCDSSDVRYEVSHAGNRHHSGNTSPGDEFDILFDYTITCWGNAQVITGEVVVSRTYQSLYDDPDTDDFVDDALAEALEKVEEIAVYECPVCGHHPHIS